MSRQWHQGDHSIHVATDSQGLQADSFFLPTAAFMSGMCQEPAPLTEMEERMDVCAACCCPQLNKQLLMVPPPSATGTCVDQHCSAPFPETRREPQLGKAKAKSLTFPTAHTNPF